LDLKKYSTIILIFGLILIIVGVIYFFITSDNELSSNIKISFLGFEFEMSSILPGSFVIIIGFLLLLLSGHYFKSLSIFIILGGLAFFRISKSIYTNMDPLVRTEIFTLITLVAGLVIIYLGNKVNRNKM
jgi:hypothetical protein